jgi:amino acid adenylation domain-containing protein
MDSKPVPPELKKKKVDYNPFESGVVTKAVPTTDVQREIWASIIMDENATLCYNECAAIDFKGPLRVDVLNLAFQELVKRHDALRTIFSSDCKSFFVKEYTPSTLKVLDYSDKDPSALEELKKEEVQFKYDLINGPCHHAFLVKTGQEQYTFLFATHHIVCDGWSIGILFNELSDYYDAILNHKILSAKEAHQFADFAIEEYKGGVNLEHKRYWLKEFNAPLIVNPFPVDLKRPSFRTFNSKRLDVTIPTPLVHSIKKLAASQGCSFYSTLMSIFNVFLYQLTKSEDIVVGMASAAQASLGRNDLIGHLVNLLPLRTTIRENIPFQTFMKSIRSKMLDAFDHQFYSYGALVRDLNFARDPSQMPLLNVVFNIDQQAPDQGLRFENVKASYVTLPRDFENFELFVNAVSSGDHLLLEIQYNSNLFTTATLENWTSNLLGLMNQIIEAPNQGVKSYDLPFLKIPKISGSAEEAPAQVLLRNSNVEEKIKKIWSKVLLNNSLEIEDNFFTVGGHSLLAIEVANLLNAEFKTSFTIKDIFENPTIVALSHKVGTEHRPLKNNLPALLATSMSMAHVSHNQMQVWYLEQMNPQTNMHNLPASIRIKNKLDRAVLEKTLHFIIDRHASLRTAITVEKGVPVQKILSSDLPRFRPRLDLIKINEEMVMKKIQEEVKLPFDLNEPPLFRAKLFELGKDDYLFFFNVHHAVWDGWSFDIFFEELNIIYSALLRNESPAFKKNPAINNVDYSSWLNNLIAEKILDRQLNYWEEKLKGPLPILDLPLDFKRPLELNHEGATVHFEISPEKAEKLREFARLNASSLFNIFLTALKITLARFSGLDDIIVGLPVRGRNHEEIMQTIGYFVNTVALRTSINLNQSFEENLKQVGKTCLEAFDNQLIPFQLVLNKLNYTRDSSRTPIFQILFAYQDVNNRSPELDGVPYTQVNIDRASANTDLDVWIKASKKKIEGGFAYRTDLFREVSMARMMECFLLILDELAENFHKPLNITKTIPQSQQNLIINNWNNTWNESWLHANSVPFHKLFEKNVKEFPQALALETSETRLTYAELDKLANRVANTLLEKGIGRGDLVGISQTRDTHLLATILGILKTGAGYVPLDPSFPQERLDYMIESSSPKILMTEDSLVSRFKNFEKKLIISHIMSETRFDNKLVPEIPHLMDDTIYVIYTSGSTGNPKGVQITHGSVLNFLLSMKDKIKTKKQDKLLAVTTLSFDIAVLELYLPLISGGSVYLASSSEVIDGVALKNILETKNPTIMQATPSTWRLLLASGWKGSQSLKILCGGEAFPIDLARTLIPICQEVWNMYGPTETTVWSACKKLALTDEFITVGKPIANTSMYVLDEDRSMRPIGVSGELFIGGYGLAKGYFGREDLTKERFMPDPFIPGKKMYATGDLARFTFDGEIECLGRNDGQVKVRGYRIELGEIEAEIQRIPVVREVAVITSEYRPGDMRIFAYISTKDNLPINERLMRESLGKKLPAYMIPSNFTKMLEIPKTLNGKIDKKSLPKILAEEVESAREDDGATPPPIPQTLKEQKAQKIQNREIEEGLRSIWMEVLGVRELKNSDNFFDIGGNSLLAVELFFKIEEKYKLNLPLSSLLQAENFGMFVSNFEIKLSPEKKAPTLQVAIPPIFKSLVAIKSTGAKNPLFCFHGVGGNVLNYIALVPATKNERPLLALQSVGLDGVTPLLESIPEMAKSYIREMKIAQPEGPYLLAGGSMGGMIAFEVAIQLVKAGDKVDKLIMFDTFGPNLDLEKYESQTKKPFFKRLKSSFFRRLEGFVAKAQSRLYRKLGIPVPLKVLLVEIERKNYSAIWNYWPKEHFHGDLHLVRSNSAASGFYSDPVMGWNGIIQGEIITYQIEGTHENFIESSELVSVVKKII